MSSSSLFCGVSPVETLQFGDPKIEKNILEARPMVIKDSNLVSSAEHWTIDYLAKNMGPSKNTVYKSKNNMFKYWSDDKSVKKLSDFVPPTTRHEMSMEDFVKQIKHKKKGSNEHWYYQNGLTDKVGQGIVNDFVKFRWDWLKCIQTLGNWGPLTSNLLLVGEEGNTTPVHYDEQENFFAQLQGKKRFFLFPPEMFKCLYPYPVFHPHDRQSQVNLRSPDFDNFPKLSELSGYHVELGPGDVLYIPMYWWHQVESLSEYTVSVTFWYKTAPTESIKYPLSFTQKLAIMRNIEKMIGEAVGEADEVTQFMEEMVVGRYSSAKKIQEKSDMQKAAEEDYGTV